MGIGTVRSGYTFGSCEWAHERHSPESMAMLFRVFQLLESLPKGHGYTQQMQPMPTARSAPMTLYSQPVNQHAGRFAVLLSAWKPPTARLQHGWNGEVLQCREGQLDRKNESTRRLQKRFSTF